MTVHELIEQLLQYDQRDSVYIYDDEYNCICPIEGTDTRIGLKLYDGSIVEKAIMLDAN